MLLEDDIADALRGGAAMAVSVGLGRFSVGLLLEPMRSGLSLTYTQAGLIATTNLACYLTGVIATPRLARRWGYSLLMRAGLALVLLSFVLLATTPGLFVALVGGASAGFAGAFAWLSMAALGSASARKGRRGLLLGVAGASVGGGIIAASLIGIVFDGPGGVDWRSAWAVQAGIAAVALLLIGKGRHPGQPTTPRAPVLRLPGFWRLAIAYCAFGLGYVVFATYVVAAALGDDPSFSRGALVWLAFGMGALPGGIGLGALSDRLGRRPVLVAMQIAGAAACMLVVADVRGLPAAALVAAPLMGATTTGMTGLVPASLADVFPKDSVGDIFATLTLFLASAQAIGPTIAGAARDSTGSFSLVFAGAAMAFVVAGWGFWGLHSLQARKT